MTKSTLFMQIIKQLYQISVRKREPQDLDYSLETAIALTMGIVFLRYASLSTMSSLSNPLAYSLASTVGESAAIYAILLSQGKASRFVQTLTALFGVTMIASAASILMTLTVILQLALPVLFIWSFYIMVLILRSALECSTAASLLLTIAYKIAGGFLLIILFPKFQTEILSEWETIKTAFEAAQVEAQSR